MKFFRFLVTAFLLVSTAGATELFDSFYIKQHYFSFVTTFDIETEDVKYGTVRKIVFDFKNGYEWKDTEGNHIARAEMRFPFVPESIDVYDSYDHLIGTISRHYFTFSPCTYSIYNSLGEKVATAAMNFWGTKFNIVNIDGDEIASLERSFFRVRSNWQMSFQDITFLIDHEIDPYLIAFCGIYRIDEENRQESERQLREMQQNH